MISFFANVKNIETNIVNKGDVAQLARALDWQSGQHYLRCDNSYKHILSYPNKYRYLQMNSQNMCKHM